jgi:hypothetical protein
MAKFDLKLLLKILSGIISVLIAAMAADKSNEVIDLDLDVNP